MKKWSASTKIVVLLVIVLIGWLVGQSVHYDRLAATIAHQVATPAAVQAERALIIKKKLARLFKDRPAQAKKQAIRTAQVFAADRSIVAVEEHHLSMAEAASGALVEFLSDLELPVRAAAADALGRMGKPAARPLIDGALSSPDKDVRTNATRALQAIGDVAVPEMMDAVAGGSPSQKIGCATAIGKLNSARAVDALIGSLSAKEEEVRMACRDALVVVGRSKTKGPNPALQPLIKALANADAFTRQHASEALGEIGDPQASPGLLKILDDPNRLVQLAATYAVGKVKDRAAVPPLIAKLTTKDRVVREAAATSLGQLGDPAAVMPLVAALKDPVDKVREQAAASLGRIAPKDAAALAAISAAAQSADEGTRGAAVFALGRIANPAAVPAIAQRLNPASETSPAIRTRAAQALGNLQSAAGVEALVTALSDSDWRVNYAAEAALSALGKLAQPRLTALLGAADPLTARYARKALVHMSPPPTAALTQLLTTAPAEARLSITLALGEIHDAAAQTTLQSLTVDPDPKVAVAAKAGLSARGGSEDSGGIGAPTPADVPPAEPAKP